jgi:hypothetical protein
MHDHDCVIGDTPFPSSSSMTAYMQFCDMAVQRLRVVNP